MRGEPIQQVSQMKLVGFVFDLKMTWGPMVDRLAKKARCKLGAIRRLRPFLDSENLKLMYTAFVRSGMEYGSVLYMGAADSHLEKLNRIRHSAQNLGGGCDRKLGGSQRSCLSQISLQAFGWQRQRFTGDLCSYSGRSPG